MRAILQRVNNAKVSVDEAVTGEIESGWLVFLGVGQEDNKSDLDYLVDKTINIRAFPDEDGKMNLSLLDIKGAVLCVSQFTLYGDCRKGRRPSFSKSGSPEEGKKYYQQYIDTLKSQNIEVASGIFGANMKVELSNDGPVTFILDSTKAI